MVNSCPAREVITSMSAPCWMRSFTQPKWPFLAATISGVWEAGKREEMGGERREREKREGEVKFQLVKEFGAKQQTTRQGHVPREQGYEISITGQKV